MNEEEAVRSTRMDEVAPEKGGHLVQAYHVTTPTILNRFGTIATYLFFSTLFVVIGCVGLLAFLWFGNESNSTWHTIVVHNWATRTVSFVSTALVWCVTTQTALCLSMLAAIALEKFYVPHSAVAEVSMMRIGGKDLIGTLKSFIYPVAFHGPRPRTASSFLVLFSTLLLLSTSTLLQFTSTFLLSDLSAFTLPESPITTENVPFNYAWIKWVDPLNIVGQTGGLYCGFPLDSMLTWAATRPTVYPTFAEYWEPSTPIQGVSDTGKTLRAFLPIASSEQRGLLKDYAGKAAVMDSRVTCIAPTFSDLTWARSPDGTVTESAMYSFTGSVAPSQSLPHIQSALSAPTFNCSMMFEFELVDRSGGGISICELDNSALLYIQNEDSIFHQPLAFPASFSGGVFSEFRDANANLSGAAYIIVSQLPKAGSEWANLTGTGSNFAAVANSLGTTQVYATLCYAALDIVDRNIQASSMSNRTEPSSAALGDQSFDFSGLFNQMEPGKSAEERGILNLTLADGETWVHPSSSESLSDGPVILPWNASLYRFPWNNDSEATTASGLPYVVNMLHVKPRIREWYQQELGGENLLIGQNQLMVGLDATVTQNWVVDLFHAFLDQDSTARALQSTLTVFASLYYYDQLPIYNKTTSMTTTSFGSHQAPRPPYRWDASDTALARDHVNLNYSEIHRVPPFFTLVVVILCIHHLLVASITAWFLTATTLSRLGDPWQAVAHVVAGNEASKIVGISNKVESDRSTAEKEMKKAGLEDSVVGIAADGDGGVILRTPGSTHVH